jgi:DNA-binding PadR family transcriptional regulator
MYIKTGGKMVSKALVAASTKPLILSILTSGESYGYQIIQRVKEVSGGELAWSEGMLYPVLHRLEKEDLIQSKWKQSDKGRMRKYYYLTDSGREALAAEKSQWETVNGALTRLWAPVFSV